jgi:hypothetical protein
MTVQPRARRFAVGALLAALPLAAVPWRQRHVAEFRPHGRTGSLLAREVRTVRTVAPAWAPPRAAAARATDWTTDTRSDLSVPHVEWVFLGAWWAAVAATVWAWASAVPVGDRHPASPRRRAVV